MDTEINQIAQSISNKSLNLLQKFYQEPQNPTLMIKQFMELTEDFQHFIQQLMNQPEKLIIMQMNYWHEALQLMNETMSNWLSQEPPKTIDRRFSNEHWINNPFFSLLSQQYVLAANHIQQLINDLEYKDESTAKKLKFFSRQYLDALSPNNYLMTNPAVMNETIKSGGKNLLKGLENLLSDLEQGHAFLSIKMTDENAFKVGENLAITPGKIIYQNALIQLIQYTPQTEKVKKTPLLIIPPWINKYYILDLSQENSLVNWLVKQGISVFILSWKNPGTEHANTGLGEYMQLGPLDAIEQIKKQLSVAKVNTLGFCIGGTLLAITLAYLHAQKKELINSATFLASLIDFSDPGDISVFIDDAQIKILEHEMEEKGYLSGKFMANTFNSLRANDLVWSFFIKNYLQGKNPAPFDILYWNADTTNMPAKMHSEYLRKMYLNNELIQKNKLEIAGVKLDINTIETPSFFVSTKRDHIAPWKSTYQGFLAFKGEKQFLLGGSGHIAGIVNPPAKNKYGYYKHNKITQDPDEWLDGALFHEGSWWPEWLKWLKKHSGGMVKAPHPEKSLLPVLENAPGSYVTEAS